MRDCARFSVSSAKNIRGGGVISYHMKILEQILEELGADTLKSFSVVPAFGGYFRSVKSIAEYTPERIVLAQKKSAIVLTGTGLEVAKYFEEDAFIKGDIKGISIE